MQHTFDLTNAKDVLVKFREIIKKDELTTTLNKFLAHSKGKPFAERYFRENYDTGIKLDQCFNQLESEGQISESFIVSIGAERAIRLATQSLQLIDYCAPAHRKALISRVNKSLTIPKDGKAYALELSVATSFSARGHKVVWPELLPDFNHSSTCDLLIPDLGENGLEVECKAIMEDTGSLIKKEQMRFFQDELDIEYSAKLSDLNGGYAIVVKSQDASKLLQTRLMRKALLERVFDVIETGVPANEDDALSITVEAFDHRPINNGELDLHSPEGANFIAQFSKSSENLSSAWIGSNGGVLIVFPGTSRQKFEKSVHETAKEAVKKQLSGERPGVIFMGVPFTPDNLRTVARRTIDGGGSNTLVEIARKTLDGQKREHLIGIFFLSESEELRTGSNSVQVSSQAYFFANEKCRFTSPSSQQILG